MATDRPEGMAEQAGTAPAEDALRAQVAQQTAKLKRSQISLRRQNARFSAAIENMAHGFSMYDRRGRLISCNQLFLDIYRLPKSCGRPGTSFREILEARVAANTHVGNDARTYVEERLRLIGRDQPVAAAQFLNSGQIIAVTHQPMADGGWVSTHKDITELHHAQQELKHLAYHDALTGIANRNLFHSTLERAKTTDTPFAVLCVDLDGFKSVNDTFGHSSGDRLLRNVAQRLSRAAAPHLVARMGGDEFCVFVEGSDHDLAATVADGVQESFSEPFAINDQHISLAASIGVARAPDDGDTIDALLTAADLALYAAKGDGRGTTHFFEPALNNAVRHRQQIEFDLRQALERSEFELHYQPIVNLHSQTFSGFEALLRWRHPRRGMVPPGEFIPVAEESGLIAPIGEWVIREAFAEAASWPEGYAIAVNVSSRQFRRGDLVGIIVNALAASGLNADRVEIEITESLFLEDSQANLETLRQLHALGLKVAMDDFGTGYSALSYLLAFPFDKIKIDGAFVRALNEAGAAHAIVGAVAEIGSRLGMTITAEGVETAEQLRNVYALGYTEAQGFLISRPISGESVERLLDADADRMPVEPFVRAAG
ncbi:MAG TPA: EAL domain-containing protein [Devosia sp.]